MTKRIKEDICRVLSFINMEESLILLESAAMRIRGDMAWKKFVEDMTAKIDGEEGDCVRRLLNGLRSREQMNNREGGY